MMTTHPGTVRRCGASAALMQRDVLETSVCTSKAREYHVLSFLKILAVPSLTFTFYTLKYIHIYKVLKPETG